MNHDEVADLLGAYALDAVDSAERATVNAHLATCARCRAELRDHREVASLLAHGGGDAPEGVWGRIAGSLTESGKPRRRWAPRRPSARYLMAAAAAAAAVVIVVLGIEVQGQDRRIDELQTALQDPLVPAFQTALQDPDSRVFELRSADGQLAVRGAVTRAGVGYLRASALPPLDAGRTYQLWGAAGDQLVSLGVLGAEPDIVSFQAGAYEGFAITEEAAPGAVVSANTPVVAGGPA